MGLDIWNKPAAACLASRIPYGTSVTRERLAQIEQFESGLKALGFRQVRVRWHEQIARIALKHVGEAADVLLTDSVDAVAALALGETRK